MVPNSRPFAVTVVGATGHTGRHCVRYLKELGDQAPRFAIAGRNRAKLDALVSEMDLPADRVGIFVVPDLTSDQANDAVDPSVLNVAENSQVILTTAGPYDLYGESVLRACVAGKTHYVDITGEVQYVRRMMRLHGAAASEAGVKIVPFSGFDSVPSDVGAFVAVQQAKQKGMEPGNCIQYITKMAGGLNGGTLVSALNIAERAAQDPEARESMSDKTPLHAADLKTKAQAELAPSRSETVYPGRSELASYPWSAPFIMSGINSAVVRASGASLDYGDQFRYHERLATSGFVESLMGSGFLISAGLAISNPIGRALARRYGPNPGEGPDDDTVYKKGRFASEMVLHEANDGEGQVRVRMDIAKDPGNGLTVACACNVALSLVEDQADPRMPSTTGILTPVQALGQPLVDRITEILSISVE